MNQPNTDGSTASVDTQPSHPAPFLAEQETEQHREHEDSQDETSSQSQLRMEQGTSTAQSQIVEQHGSSPFTESESHVFSRFAQEAVLRHRKSTLQWAHNPPDQAAALHHRECPTRGSRAPSPRVPRLAVQASYARSVYQTGSRAPSPRAPRLAVQASDAQSAHRTRYNGLVIAFCFLASLYPQGAALHHRESSLGKQLAMLQYAACPAAH
ncbi:hypothetical protein EMCRGX_G027976 [Ephydatia muelleri]